MYRISRTTDGGLVGYTDDLRLIRRKFGLYVNASPGTATGIAHRGKVYNLAGTEGVGAAETVNVLYVDPGELADETTRTGEALAALEDAMCEVDAANEEWKAGIEDALCEIDSAESEE